MPDWYLPELETMRDLGYRTEERTDLNQLITMFLRGVCDWYPEDIRKGRPHGEEITIREWQKRHGNAEGKL